MKNFVFVAALALTAQLAFADSPGQQQQTPFARRHGDLNTLRRACANPGGQGLQLRPDNIILNCEYRSTQWRQISEQPISLDNVGSVTGQADSSKVVVGRSTAPQAIPSDQFSCPVMQRHQLSGARDFPIDCDVILAVPANVRHEQLCRQYADAQGGDVYTQATPMPGAENIRNPCLTQGGGS